MAAKTQKVEFEGQELVVIPDGKLCPDAYQESAVRVVHVLKEPTKDEGLGKKLLKNISSGRVKRQIWHVTARRTYALQNNLPDWSCLKEKEDRFGDAFKSCAVINLNDTIRAGSRRPVTDKKKLLSLAKFRWPQRKDCLLSLMPFIAVCAGTFELMKELLNQTEEEFRSGERGKYFVWNGMPFIHAYHPSFRGIKHQKEYESFQSLCFQAKEEMPGLGIACRIPGLFQMQESPAGRAWV